MDFESIITAESWRWRKYHRLDKTCNKEERLILSGYVSLCFMSHVVKSGFFSPDDGGGPRSPPPQSPSGCRRCNATPRLYFSLTYVSAPRANGGAPQALMCHQVGRQSRRHLVEGPRRQGHIQGLSLIRITPLIWIKILEAPRLTAFNHFDGPLKRALPPTTPHPPHPLTTNPPPSPAPPTPPLPSSSMLLP